MEQINYAICNKCGEDWDEDSEEDLFALIMMHQCLYHQKGKLTLRKFMDWSPT